MIQQGNHAKLEELFVPNGNGALSYFYASNKIISNPTIMSDILHEFPDLSTQEQQKILQEIISILDQVTTNSYALNGIKQPTIIQLLIDLIPNYVDNYLIFNKMLVILDHLLKMSTTDQKLIEKSIKKLVVQLHAQEGSIQSKSIFGTINILKSFLNCKINMDKQPEKMIVFHGGNGLEIRPKSKREINWMFSNGMSIYFWLNIQNIKFGTETSLPKLFTFYSPNNGGLQCYLIDNKIHYRTVGSKYNSPKIGSNGICLGQIQPKKWYFIGIQHEGPKRILGRSHINFRINDKKITYNLSPPSISSKQKLKIVFFDRVYCKSSSICVFPFAVEDDFAESLNKNKNSIDLIKNPKAFIFQERQGGLYQRSDLGYCPDPILHRNKQMSFQNIIPIFHMCKFVKEPSSYPILNELLSLFVLFLYKSPLNQIEAHKKNYLHIMSQLIKSLPKLTQKFNEDTVNILLHIKQTITNPQLLRQYHGEFLWSFVDSKIAISSKQMLLQIIKNNFTQNVLYFSNIIGLDQMLNVILKLAPPTIKCCQKHYKIMIKRFNKDLLDSQDQKFGQNQLALEYVLKIIQLYIQNQKLNTAQQIYKLCRLLSIKFSPCFTISLVNVIRRILTDKINQKLNGGQAKKIIEYLMNKKVYLMFIHVIQNSFFAEIKADCIRVLYTLLLKKISPNEQQLISFRLSRALWKINEENSNQSNLISQAVSPAKNKDDEDMPPEILQMSSKKSSKKGNINPMKMSFSSDDQSDNMMTSKNKASSIFKQVGPQAPQLTNRMKGSKTFSFNFMNQEKQKNSKRGISISQQYQPNFDQFQQIKNKKRSSINQLDFKSQQIMEQYKTNQNEIGQQIQQNYYYQKPNEQSLKYQKLDQTKGKKKPKILGLNIDTDEINKMYTFGGQKGQQIMVSQQQKQAQIQKIRKLAKICVAAMKGQKYQPEKPQAKLKTIKPMPPPSTTSNRILKARQQLKIQQLKHIDEESEPQSAVKKPTPTMKINTSIPSPNFGSKKSKSPTSMTSISEQNMIVLYNSLMQSCISIPKYDMVTPSIMYIFFAWIPQTNLEVKFLFDLGLIMENDENHEKIRTLAKMPQLYDFLFELIYKALLFEEMGEKRLYTQKLEQIIKKIFSFVFREEPECLDKFSFIIDWALQKSKQYHPKCLFLASRYIFFLIMDGIEEDLYTNKKIDKLMERNFQYLGMAVNKFCKFLPIQYEPDSDYAVTVDQFDRVIFKSSFSMVPSIAPYFTTSWVDNIICEKYILIFKKFFCTDWYSKNLKLFQAYLTNNNITALQNVISTALTSQYLLLCAESQYYTKNSFIFTLTDINRYLFIQKKLSGDKIIIEKSQVIWETIVIVLFAESLKDKNQNNSQFIMGFLKNCKVFCNLQFNQAAIIINLIKCARETIQTTLMSGSGIHESAKQSKNSQKYGQFVQFLIQSYVNQKLFQQQKNINFQNFKLNFRQIWIPGEHHQTKIKSELYVKFLEKQKQIQENTSQYIEQLSNLIQQQSQRAENTEVLIETYNRNARSNFRKLWKNLRIFGSPWKHPQFSLQNDTLFNKSLFTYERYEASKFYKLKICKHMSKYRFRYFLKPLLFQQTTIPSSQQSNQISNKQQIGLNHALLSYNEGKLLLGLRIVSWIFPKQQINTTNPMLTNITIRPLDIYMNFKKVRMVKTLTVRHGYLCIINDRLLFINAHYKETPSHLSIAEYKIKQDKSLYKSWPLEYIKQIFKRRYVNRKRALQINFIYGKSVMFEFYQGDHEEFIKKIVKLKGSKCPNLIYNNKTIDPKKVYEAQELFKKWNNYEISNFQYLMQINNLAGRSYCDLTQYPVMPWILINFQGKLVMSEEKNLRNLTLPMGALGSQQRTQGFMERYNYMAELQTEKFHYGTHYSSPAIIYHFLVRLSPFTEGAILLQSGKFDFADRLFFSMIDSFKNATSQYSDVRQLIPQMYTFPEAYININKLDLGVMQNCKRVHNVELPLWSRQNPYLYVTKLRKAFQELTVSKNISKWIDLIFGFKQKGEEAVRSLNCYVHITYQDSIKFQQVKDEKTVKALQTQIVNFGQTPSQLFTKVHQQRVSPSSLPNLGTICDPNIEAKIYRPSKHTNVDLLKDEKQQFNAMRQSGQSIIHMKWFKDSRLVFIRRNGDMLFYKWNITPPGSKIPFQCSIEKQKSIPRINRNLPQNIEYYDGSLKTDSFPIQFINNGHNIALGGLADGKLLIIDTDTNSIQNYTEHSYTICCVRSDLKENFLITGDIEGHVIVWRINNGNRLSFYYSIKDHNKQITSIFIAYDLRCLFTSSMDGSVFGYNIITGKKMKIFYHPKQLPINNVIVSTSPLAVVILFCNQESIIYCYSLNGQLIQRVHDKQFQHFLSPVLIRDTLGFEHIAYGNQHGETLFRTLPFLDNPIKHIVAKDAAVNRVCLSKSNKFVIVGCSDGDLSVITAPDTQNTPK